MNGIEIHQHLSGSPVEWSDLLGICFTKNCKKRREARQDNREEKREDKDRMRDLRYEEKKARIERGEAPYWQQVGNQLIGGFTQGNFSQQRQTGLDRNTIIAIVVVILLIIGSIIIINT